MTKTAEERDALLASLGLNPTEVVKEAVAPVSTPVQTDFHTMPVTDIVFDEADIAGFDLETQFSEASRVLFAKYRATGRNKDRNSLLHSRITQFLGAVRKSRRPEGGHVREEIALLNLIRASGLTVEQITAAYEATK